MRLLHTVMALFVALALAACGASQSATPAAKEGSTPSKVVVLDYNVLDTMDALGLGDKVVAVPTKMLPEHLKKYADRKNAGSLAEPDMEAIAGIAPDAILIGGRTLPKKDELAKIGKTVDMSVDATNYMPDFQAKQRELGKLFDKSAEVDAQLKKLDEQIAATKAKAAGKGTALVVLVSGGKVSAFGPKSRFGLVHDQLGLTPAATDLKVDKHGQPISFEFIAKTNPDMLFVIDRDAAIGQQGKSAQQVLDNELVATTKAWKNKKVTYLDGARWYLLGNGLTNLGEMVKAVDAGIA